MDEKTSLLEQLRIDRGEEGSAARQGGMTRESAARMARRWRWIAGACAALALIACGGVAWLWLVRPHATASSIISTNGTSAADAGGATDGAAGSTAGSPDAASGSDAAAASDTTTSAARARPAGKAVSVLDASGYIVAQREATVSAKTIGRMRDLLIEEGQHVTAGQVIARLDDSNTLAALAQARAQLAQAEAGLEAARTALTDARPIFTRNQQERTASVISAQDFDTAKSAFDNAQSTYATQEAAVSAARANLVVAERAEDDMIVRAPFSGVVTDKAAQPGEIVSPMSSGGFTRTGICTIVDMDSLEAEVDVSENFINRVHPGQPAVVRLNAYPDWEIPASVVAIIPTADRSKATVKVRVGFKVKDPRILPEMGARVSFLDEGKRADDDKRAVHEAKG